MNPVLLQAEHLDKLNQVQHISEITYHNYITLLCTTAFQLDLKRPKHSTHDIQVHTSKSTPNNNNNDSGCGGKGHSQNSGHSGHGNDNKSTANCN